MLEQEWIRMRMPEEKEELLKRYINERRYGYVLTVIVLCIMTVFLLIIMFHAIEQMQKGIFVVRFRRRYHYYAMDIAECAAMSIVYIFVFLRGWGKKFGPNSDIDCVKHMKYQYGTAHLSEKDPDAKKHPYYVMDREGNRYICPVFLEYRNMDFGEEMFCVVLDNGSRYAFQLHEIPWWEKD